MDIRGFLPTSLNEWPGKMVAVIWTAGCNFRCPFCQNRELVLQPEKLARLDQEKIIQDLRERQEWLDGVVVTGGEPTLQPDLADFLKQCRQLGLATMLETNASQPKILATLNSAKLLDRISIDIKGDFADYRRFTGTVTVAATIKKSLRLILASGVALELRTTVVPTLHTKANLVRLAKQLKNVIENCKLKSLQSRISSKCENFEWFLQQFVAQNCLNPEFEKIKPYSDKELQSILAVVQKHIPLAKLRGI